MSDKNCQFEIEHGLMRHSRQEVNRLIQTIALGIHDVPVTVSMDTDMHRAVENARHALKLIPDFAACSYPSPRLPHNWQAKTLAGLILALDVATITKDRWERKVSVLSDPARKFEQHLTLTRDALISARKMVERYGRAFGDGVTPGSVCPKCHDSILVTSGGHGVWCPSAYCKYGWEIDTVPVPRPPELAAAYMERMRVAAMKRSAEACGTQSLLTETGCSICVSGGLPGYKCPHTKPQMSLTEEMSAAYVRLRNLRARLIKESSGLLESDEVINGLLDIMKGFDKLRHRVEYEYSVQAGVDITHRTQPSQTVMEAARAGVFADQYRPVDDPTRGGGLTAQAAGQSQTSNILRAIEEVRQAFEETAVRMGDRPVDSFGPTPVNERLRNIWKSAARRVRSLEEQIRQQQNLQNAVAQCAYDNNLYPRLSGSDVLDLIRELRRTFDTRSEKVEHVSSPRFEDELLNFRMQNVWAMASRELKILELQVEKRQQAVKTPEPRSSRFQSLVLKALAYLITTLIATGPDGKKLVEELNTEATK